MLKSTRKKVQRGGGARIAIVASLYNQEYVDGMLAAAEKILEKAGVSAVEVHRVPGSYEIPVLAAALARRQARRPDAIICFGLIWQGETTHAQHIGEAVSFALMDLAMESGVPVIHQVLTVSSQKQAKARCLDEETNRGAEGAHTALAMVAALRGL